MRVVPVLLLFALALSCGGEEAPPDPPDVVLGELEVRWRFQARDGSPRDCAALGLDEVQIAIGSEPKVVPCTDGMVLFQRLLPERYPVVGRALTSGGVRATVQTNATVVAEERAVAELVFELDSEAGTRGRAVLRWTIDNQSPRVRCDEVGGVQVRVRSITGSAQSIDEVGPCDLGELELEDLAAGGYEVALRLEDADGMLIASAMVPIFQVRASMIAEPSTSNFITTSGSRTYLETRWTINSSAAAAACDSVLGESVTITAVPRPPAQVRTSTTVPCAAGSTTFETGAGPYTIRFDLHHDLTAVTSTSVRIELVRGRTSSVAVDFVVR